MEYQRLNTSITSCYAGFLIKVKMPRSLNFRSAEAICSPVYTFVVPFLLNIQIVKCKTKQDY